MTGGQRGNMIGMILLICFVSGGSTLYILILAGVIFYALTR